MTNNLNLNLNLRYMRLDSSLHTALYEQGCLRYPGPKTGFRGILGLNTELYLVLVL